MKRRLLLAIEVIEFLGRLKKKDREMLLDRMERIRDFPSHFADFHEIDKTGDLDVHVTGRFAISFWDDSVDRHVKIMALRWADRPN
ncbi:MAG: hypothetical protein QOE70_6587 [Chthoniobacter sp.]|nr:hypothetical protein [Chthoniobacter sp.]